MRSQRHDDHPEQNSRAPPLHHHLIGAHPDVVIAGNAGAGNGESLVGRRDTARIHHVVLLQVVGGCLEPMEPPECNLGTLQSPRILALVATVVAFTTTLGLPRATVIGLFAGGSWSLERERVRLIVKEFTVGAASVNTTLRLRPVACSSP